MGILHDLFRPNLKKLEEKKDVSKLLDIFVKRFTGYNRFRENRPDAYEVRDALVRIGEPSVAPLLNMLELGYFDSYVMDEIISVLGDLKDLRAVKPLIAWWNHHKTDFWTANFVEGTLGRALEKIGGEEAITSDPYLKYIAIRQQAIEQERREHAIKRIIVLMNKRPAQNEAQFVDLLLSTMKVNEKTYKAQCINETDIHTFEAGDLDFSDEMAVLASCCFGAYIQICGSPLPKEDIKKLTLAPFESPGLGIKGNIVAEFYERQ